MTEREKGRLQCGSSKAEKEERIERQAGQCVETRRVVGGCRGMPHIKIREYKGTPQWKRVGENERRGAGDCDSWGSQTVCISGAISNVHLPLRERRAKRKQEESDGKKERQRMREAEEERGSQEWKQRAKGNRKKTKQEEEEGNEMVGGSRSLRTESGTCARVCCVCLYFTILRGKQRER